MSASTIKGVAGEAFETGQAVYRGDDGKYYLATTKGHVGVAARPIATGQPFTEDANHPGHFLPLDKPD